MKFTDILNWFSKAFEDLMGLRKTFRDWKNERDYQRDDDAFCRGFGYAMSEYFIKKVPMETLEAQAFGVNNTTEAFDRGIFTAIVQIKDLAPISNLVPQDPS